MTKNDLDFNGFLIELQILVFSPLVKCIHYGIKILVYSVKGNTCMGTVTFLRADIFMPENIKGIIQISRKIQGRILTIFSHEIWSVTPSLILPLL